MDDIVFSHAKELYDSKVVGITYLNFLIQRGLLTQEEVQIIVNGGES